MALSDYPPVVINWNTGLPPEMLRALGTLAVLSAGVEEMLHQIYWHHAGLDERIGPIVTDNLNPKKLEEDIKKLVQLDHSKANILADLKILFAEFRTLNTKRNHCLHWIWDNSTNDTPFSFVLDQPIAYRLKRPLYRQSGELAQDFTVADVRNYCNQFAWLSQRLRSHTFSDEALRKKRDELINSLPINGVSQADLFWPAPWLDKPLPPEPKRHNPPGT